MLYIEKFSIWKATSQNQTPRLEYVDSLFRRRLSQCCKMTIEVVKNVVEKNGTFEDLPLCFASTRGEIVRQLKINRSLVEDHDVSPAQFSLSTFNAPPAVASIALGLKSGYSAVYSTKFKDSLIAAASQTISANRIIFAFADEKIPDEYTLVSDGVFDEAFAFAVILSTKETPRSLKSLDFDSAQDFIRFLET